MDAPKTEVTRTLLAVITIAFLIFASLWVLQPFIGGLIWATMVVVATWPLMIGLQKRLWGRRSLATAVMVGVLLLVLFVPLTIAITTVVTNANKVAELVPRLQDATVPAPPAWLATVPLVGEKLSATWQGITESGIAPILATIKPYAGTALKWTASHAGSLGLVVIQFLLTVAIAGILYSTGEQAARGVRGFARRLAGDQGDRVVILAGQAIRGVAMGIVVTALVQSTLGGLGLLICGVPFAGLLTAVMFMCCLAQIGPILVLAPAVGWLYWTGDTTWGTVLLVWTLVVGSLDNILRPWLIKKGADLPLLLIFAGVIGGLFAFGLVGLFIGPVVLAVTYTLLDAWIGDAWPAKDEI
ncbi:AI-2E family transporter YdiK [Niveibacterium umoris]|uniref:Putative PurR-regulated permease PerM n=1 Tax=Niveibacterium umoris TaxID=1193620 RepID=A0A840BKZ1_9RHOO|nr:AI-2E family transporter YdiK [Niveibacterium umoris]MBB4013660.1 putative PurR-regulated permease PerM [Niveibacterium umoris]